jgi:FAD:protein FMN transferase
MAGFSTITSPGPTPPRPRSFARRLTSGVRVQRLRPAMGTWVTIEATAPTESQAVAAIEAAYAAIADVEWRMHPRREGSELAFINSAAPQTSLLISDPMWRVFRLAHAVHALCDGAFDPCLPSHPGRLTDLALSPAGMPSRSALCRVPLALDLGGIAKGYAIDRAIEALRAAACDSGCVNAGGDLRLYGRTEQLLLRRADGACEPLTLTNRALAVTDLEVDARQRPAEHQGYYRRCGPGAPRNRYAAVVAASAVVADALTKCVLFADSQCAARALRALGARRVGRS